MCMSTDQLKLLDMANYFALGFSYDTYLKGYGCEVTKSHFRYEYMDCLEKVDDTTFGEGRRHYVWRRSTTLRLEKVDDTTFGEGRRHYVSAERRLLQSTEQRRYFRRGLRQLRTDVAQERHDDWYNNRDVVPCSQAIHRQFAFYEQCGNDMFKQGISVPGLTLPYLFSDLPEKTKIFISS